MSRDAFLSRRFAGKLRGFRLGLDQWEKVDEARRFGPAGGAVLFKRTALALEALAAQDLVALARIDHRELARPADLREVILWGLVGDGMTLPDADALVAKWVDDRPLMENLDLAYALCMATLVQVEDDKVGEPGAGEGTESPTSLADG